MYVIEILDLVGFWEVKIKIKPMILCARSASRSREQSTKRRLRRHLIEKVVHFIVKLTRLYDYQIWRTRSFCEIGAQRFVGFFS